MVINILFQECLVSIGKIIWQARTKRTHVCEGIGTNGTIIPSSFQETEDRDSKTCSPPLDVERADLETIL